ncbi:MAG: ADP-ribosylglycohydrolase family protein [Erysipelotrichaceae bacterium]|nr:ADP-ribosylglycohydrolase family protein [Erysipelotrichaceae bacterium]
MKSLLLNDTNREEYLRKVYASWLGKIIGVRLGAPVENFSYEEILEKYGIIDYYPVDYGMFAADDDTNGPLFFVRALLDKDKISAKDIGDAFLDYIQEYSGFFWWGGVGVSSEHTAFENLKNGIKAPRSGSMEVNGEMIAEQIGGQIFSDCWGYVAGYDPDLAKKLAMMASSVTHDGNGIQGGIFVAVAIALAMQHDDIRKVIDLSLEYLDPEMEYYLVAKDIIRFHDEHPLDHHLCLEYIHEHYGYDKYPGTCHIIPNMAVMIMALTYGDNGFDKTLCICTQAGWDTDCNAGNVGSIMGALVGIEGIDPKWILPLNDSVNASSAIGCLNINTISETAYMFANIGLKLKGLEPLKYQPFHLPYSTSGFIADKALAIKDDKLIMESDSIKKYAYYLPDDVFDARYDPEYGIKVYPGDVINFRVEAKDNEVEVYIVDCSGKRYLSDCYLIDKPTTVSYAVPKGINLTVNYYGLIKHKQREVLISDFWIDSNPDITIDLKSYPIDEYGPRYAGDSLYNIRGFVRHSGEYEISDKGLTIKSKDHALISYGSYDFNDLVYEVTFTPIKGETGFVFNMKGCQHFYALLFHKNGISFIKKDTQIMTLNNVEYKWYYNQSYRLIMKMNCDRLTLVINDEVVDLSACGVSGIGQLIGIMLNKDAQAIIENIKLYKQFDR